MKCPSCGGTSFERERDILDVWFDSGSSHEAVLARTPELGWPSDMYLEGSDQHRGWFQSSLLVALATRGRPPFREVLTHGFLIDLEGRKMSKSLGNAISPQDVIKESGAEIIRLWVSMTEFTEELRVSKEILTRVVDVYRKLRNTCRILVANLYDFDPATDMVPLDALDEVDRFALARYAEAAQRMIRAYDDYDFSVVVPDVEHAGDRRPQRLLRGRDEGLDVHAGREVARAAFDADGDVSHLRRTGAPAGADSAGDRGLSCGSTSLAGDPGRFTSRSSRRSKPTRTRRCSRPGRRCSTCGKRSTRRSRRNARTRSSAPRLARGVIINASGPIGALLKSRRDDLPMLFNRL